MKKLTYSKRPNPAIIAALSAWRQKVLIVHPFRRSYRQDRLPFTLYRNGSEGLPLAAVDIVVDGRLRRHRRRHFVVSDPIPRGLSLRHHTEPSHQSST
jgi:hypothetical protein